MTCLEFERVWNERLDSKDASASGLVEVIGGHPAACPACRALDARYRALELAIRARVPSQAIAAPEGFANRVLAASSRGERPSVFRFPTRLTALVAAAAIVGAVMVGLRLAPRATKTPDARPELVRAIEPNGLTESMADAGSATWDLARQASAPAARVGRQMLGAASLPRTAPALSLPDGVRPPADVWRRLEDRVNAGVRPIEGTARHAFGFLLGVSDDGDPAPPAEGA